MSEIESISREDLGWLSGFVDGEGCFYLGFMVATDRKIPRKTLRTMVFIGNTAVEPLIKVSQILSKTNIGFTTFLYKKPSNIKWSRAMHIKICGHGRTEKFSRMLLPYLTCKKEQAKQMIYACEYRRKLSESNGGNNKNSSLIHDPVLNAMSERMKELNHFRSDLTAYSRNPNCPIQSQRPSTTERLTALSEKECLFKLSA